MSNFVYDNLSVPATKSDHPATVARNAAIPANQKWNATELNQLSAAATGLRTALEDGTPFFNVKRYGAVGDGVTDDTDAIEDAIAAAAAAGQAVNGLITITPVVYFPEGAYIHTRPFFIPPTISVVGAGAGSTCLAWKHAAGLNWAGYTFLAAQSDPGVYGLQYVADSGGTALVVDYDGGDRDHTETFLDLAQYHGGRLSTNWTIRFARKFTEVDQGHGIWTVGAQTAWSEEPVRSTALSFQFDPIALDGSLSLRLRFNNIYNDVAVETASYTTLAVDTWYEFEIAYNNTTGRLYVFINGELWTNGAWAPPGGAGDGTKFKMWPWERMTIGSVAAGYYPSESAIGTNARGVLRGVHISEVVRHTANYSATPTTDPTADGSTRLLVNFDQLYQGHVVGRGISGNETVYLYPVLFHAEEQANITIAHLSTLQGLGLRLEFASKLRMIGVDVNYPIDGVLLTRNGYFANFKSCNVTLAERVGWLNEGGSGVTYDGLFASAPMCFAMVGTNITAIGCSAGLQGGGVCSVSVQAGSNVISGFLVDAELNTGNTWQATLAVEDGAPCAVIGGQWYNPPDHLTESPILIRNTDATANVSYSFLAGWFGITPTTTPLIRLVGTQTNLANKIVVANPSGRTSGDLCDTAGQAFDPFSVRPTAQQGISGTDVQANNLRGSLAIADANTTGTVTFATAETNGTYYLTLTPVTVSGGAAAGASRVRSVSKSGANFVVTLEAAPGAGEAVTFDWHLIR